MTWNISSECISLVTLCIIWVYSRKGNPLPTLKNRLFQACFLVTFCAMSSNVLSTMMLYHYRELPLFLTWLVNTVYFVATPLMGTVYYFYAVAVLFEHREGAGRIMAWSAVPAGVYLLLVLFNPLSKSIFDILPDTGYVRGPLIFSTYLVFYLYCTACFVLTLIKGEQTDPAARRILAVFPLVAASVIVVQQIFPDYILSGSAATCALLLLYLYLQNKQISIDHLTGAPNRQEFLNALDHRLHKRRDMPFLVLVLSLKNFKAVNNSFGQQNGDLFLQEICKYLREAAAPCPLYRYSGDEFAVILEDEQYSRAHTLVQTLQERLARPWSVKGYQCVIPGVFGVVRYPISADSKEEIISGIEYAVARAKLGKAGAAVYGTPEMLKSIRRRDRIVDVLKQSLKTGDFQVYYQPILSLDTHRFTLAESLLRMPDTPMGPLYPNEFIPIAEDTGLIVEITYQVLEQVCVFLRRLLDEGRELDGISVNFSSLQFSQPDVKERIDQILRTYGIPYGKIKIEITERVVSDNYEMLTGFIAEMHRRGIRFGLDDFGTGYSNISTVFNLPLDTIKLDKSLVDISMLDQKYALAVRQFVRVFKAFGMNVLAEGVETPAQSEFVAGCGCDMIQGYLYARPMPAEQAASLLGRALADTVK